MWFAGGVEVLRIASCLEVLDRFMRQSCPVVSSMVVADKHAGSDRPATIVDCIISIMGMSRIYWVIHSCILEK
jgi:hypothetical protein